MNKIRSYFIILFVSLLTACASVPQGAVDLSTEVGVGLKKQYESQVDLVNLNFSIRRQMLDDAMEKALKTYFEGLTPTGTIELNRSQLGDVAKDVMEFNVKNNAAKEELEKARLLLIKQLNDNYLALNLANTSVTVLLQSAVSTEEARSEAFQSLSKATDGNVDLDEVFTELDQFVLKGGEEAGKAINLVDDIKSLIEKGDKNEDPKK